MCEMLSVTLVSIDEYNSKVNNILSKRTIDTSIGRVTVHIVSDNMIAILLPDGNALVVESTNHISEWKNLLAVLNIIPDISNKYTRILSEVAKVL